MYKSKWLWGYVLVLVFSIVDWVVTISLGCNEVTSIFLSFSLHCQGFFAYGKNFSQLISGS